MKIDFAKNPPPVRVDDIPAGVCFQIDDDVVCLMCDNGTFVNLDSGEVWQCGAMNDQYGILIDAKVVVG